MNIRQDIEAAKADVDKERTIMLALEELGLPSGFQDFDENWNVKKGVNEERKKRAEQYIDTHGHLMMWELLVSFAASEVEMAMDASRRWIAERERRSDYPD